MKARGGEYMKKVLSVLVVLLVTFLLVACGSEDTYEIAMITDVGDIDDKSFNQGTWEGIEEWATENNKSHKYYKPSSATLNDYVAAIDLAVASGAKIVITPGYLFENAIHKAQDIHPDIKFVLIDGSPHNVSDWGDNDTPPTTYDGEDQDFTVGDNTYSIFFKEQESGFFAGYAAYTDGKESLAFLGGLPVPAVIRFGVGFVAGAYYAADLAEDTAYTFAPVNYEYAPSGFAPSDDVVNWASARFTAGIDAIFAAAGGAGQSVFQAASSAGSTKWGIGVDVDQGPQHAKVLTSAMKGLGVVVKDALDAFYDDEFPGGQSVTLGAADDAVGLPTVSSSWRFATLTVAAYENVYDLVAAGTIVVPGSSAELATYLTGLGYTIPEGLAAKIAD